MWKWLKDNVEQAVLGIALLPVIFKFGTTDNPIYYTLAEGWKNTIDWKIYEESLKE